MATLDDLELQVQALQAYIPPGGGILVTAAGLQQLLQPINDALAANGITLGNISGTVGNISDKTDGNTGTIGDLQSQINDQNTSLQAANDALAAAVTQAQTLQSLIDSEGAARESGDASNVGSIITIQDLFSGVFRYSHTYNVATADPQKLSSPLDVPPLSRDKGVLYKCEARTSDGGYDAVATLTCDGTAWTLSKDHESATTGAAPEFFIDADGDPAIRPYDSTDPVAYSVQFERHNSQFVPPADDETARAAIANEATIRQDADTAAAATVALIGAKNAGGTAFILNQDTAMVDSTTTLAEYISGVSAAQDGLQGNINTEQSARVIGDQTNADAITSVKAGADTTKTNYCANPSGDDGTLSGWTYASGSTANFFVGSWSAGHFFSMTGGTSGVFSYAYYEVTPAYAVGPWTFSVDCYSLVGLSQGGSAYLQLYAKDANGNNVATSTAQLVNGQRVSTTISAPAGTVKIQALVVLYGSATQVDWRAVKIENSDHPTAFTIDGAVAANAVVTQQISASVNAVTEKVNASYTLALDVNGKVVGMVAQNNGAVGSLVFNFDNVQITNGAGSFSIVGGITVNKAGAYMKVTGPGFGASSDLVEWYGPQMAVSSCTKANALYYLAKDGSAYFGGSLSAGVLKNAATSTQISGTASVDTGAFGTNGHSKTVVCSFSYACSGQMSSNPGSASTSATVTLQRSYAGGAWTTIGTINATGQRTSELDSPGVYIVSVRCGGTITVTDNQAGTGTFGYRAVISNAVSWPFTINGNQGNQTLTVVSTEQ